MSTALQYVELNYKSENFQKLLAVRGDFDRDNTRRSRIFEDCTLLPEDLPPRVYELADEITRDCETPYEELEAIRTYLLGYSYSTTTEVLEEGRDFADCFLFDTKSGYCTSFATAMAVLGRCRGIPTRYVEGFAHRSDMQRGGYGNPSGRFQCARMGGSLSGTCGLDSL